MIERRLTVTDLIEGRCRSAVARFHLGPGVLARADAGHRSGDLTTPSGRVVRWTSSQPARIEASEWRPRFGERRRSSSWPFRWPRPPLSPNSAGDGDAHPVPHRQLPARGQRAGLAHLRALPRVGEGGAQGDGDHLRAQLPVRRGPRRLSQSAVVAGDHGRDRGCPGLVLHHRQRGFRQADAGLRQLHDLGDPRRAVHKQGRPGDRQPRRSSSPPARARSWARSSAGLSSSSCATCGRSRSGRWGRCATNASWTGSSGWSSSSIGAPPRWWP